VGPGRLGLAPDPGGLPEGVRPMNVLPHLLAYLGPALLALGATLGGAWTFLPTGFVFGLLPILDDRVGRNDANPEVAPGGSSWAADLALWLFVPVQTVAIVAVLFHLTRGDTAVSLVETIGLTVSLGLISGSGGIVVAHELMHRAGRFPKALAEILMTETTYAHFCVEHVHGHHRHVATPRDPASSRRGESVFAFVPRSILGGAISAWRIESERTARQGTSWTLRDRRLRMPLVTGLVYAGVAAAFGRLGVLVFLAQGAFAVVLLEVINYLEHYGLARRETAPGQYERVGPEHSWNSSHRVSNWYLFNLARHSDHHYLASRPYESLRHWDEREAPQLPTGYAAMLLVALAPPLWFRIMNPRVDAWNHRRSRAAVGDEPGSSAEQAGPVAVTDLAGRGGLMI
jgi:alkane 1-monooxygenase